MGTSKEKISVQLQPIEPALSTPVQVAGIPTITTQITTSLPITTTLTHPTTITVPPTSTNRIIRLRRN